MLDNPLILGYGGTTPPNERLKMYYDDDPYDAYADDSAYEQDYYDDYDGLTDAEADAMTLAGAGYGTDEDYGYFGNEDAAMESYLFGDC